jgi:hypothetical protein
MIRRHAELNPKNYPINRFNASWQEGGAETTKRSYLY